VHGLDCKFYNLSSGENPLKFDKVKADYNRKSLRGYFFDSPSR